MTVKLGVQPGVPRAVFQRRVPVLRGAVCWGRDSDACQGQHSSCPASSPQHCRENLGVEGAIYSGAGSFYSHKGVVWVRAAHSSRSHPGHLPGKFQKQIKAGVTWKEKCFLGLVLSVSCGEGRRKWSWSCQVCTKTVIHTALE